MRKTAQKDKKRVIIVSSGNTESLLRKLKGIEEYAQTHRHIEFVRPAGIPIVREDDLKVIELDGVIGATALSDKTKTNLHERGIAYVKTVNMSSEPQLPAVLSDMKIAGRVAADHLVKQGFTDFGFVGLDYFHVEMLREGYTGQLARHGFACHALDVSRLSPVHQWDSYSALLKQWLDCLPKPAVVFTYSDYRAAALITIARKMGFDIPNDIAVVGVGNDPFESALLHISLTSVALNYERIGYEAMKLLDGLMRGKPTPDEPVLVPPIGIAEGDSTDTIKTASPVVRRAIGIIRQNLRGQLSTDLLANQLAVSRRTLQRSFKQALGHGVHEEILHSRLRLAQRLLTDTVLPIGEIAERCGFADLRALSVTYKKRFGVTPSAFRAKHFTCTV